MSEGNPNGMQGLKDSHTLRNSFRPFMPLVIFMVSIIVGVPAAWTQESAPVDAAQPIRFQADQSVFDSRAGQAVLQGRVKVTQAANTIVADFMTITFRESNSRTAEMDPDSIERIEARGNVRIEFDNRLAMGEKAEYMAAERKLIISGKGTRFVDGKDEISAGRITYYRDEGKVEFDSSESQQVKGTIHTSEKGLN